MKRIPAFVIASTVAGGAAWLLACGPITVDLEPVLARRPADDKAYAKGDLGVVRPAFSLGYLLQAYRTLAPRPPARAAATAPVDAAPGPTDFAPDPVGDWTKTSAPLLDAASSTSPRGFDRQNRHVPGDAYQTFLNCPDEAFAGALRTLQARGERFGGDSAAVRDWTRAQTAVFDNCHDGPLVLPIEPPATADALTRADRAYQTAAAYFYAIEYEEAARRFRAIGTDRSSPWRPFGRYLAARANIRLATVPAKDARYDRDRLLVAETDLRAVLADTSAAPLHPSARGLLGYLSARIHPLERLHELSSRLTASPDADDQDFYDYRFILNTISDAPASPVSRSEIVRGDDLTDWLLTMRNGGEAAAARAVARWRADQTLHWLIAALWMPHPSGADADALLDAAQRLDRQSPAFATAAFLRVRLLISLGRPDEARAALGSLPSRPGPGFGAETVNLLRAERLMLATSLDQFLVNAPRAVVVEWADASRIPNGRLALKPTRHDEPVLDEDAATMLAEQFPLTRLVDAALSPRLPRRLRLRVAMAALTRAIVLKRDEAGARLVPALRELAPALAVDLERYARAGGAADRYTAGVLLLLNTPGATVDVRGPEDDFWFAVAEPAREFDHLFRRNWWCESRGSFHRTVSMNGPSESVRLLYPDGRVPAPRFLTAAERDAAAGEQRAILAEGPPRHFLGRAAIQLADQHPDDPAAADALARVVDGWRWTCGEDDTAAIPLPQQAFVTLHRLFKNSAAAQRTKYWYRD